MSADPMLAGMQMFEAEPAEEETATEPVAGEEVGEDERKPLYANAGEWVSDWMLPHWRRNPARFHWDPQWWRYEEAGSVIEALWASWEQSRIDPDPRVMAGWFLNVFYPLMAHLTGEDGPFWAYKDSLGRTDVPPVFPVAPAPPGWFE